MIQEEKKFAAKIRTTFAVFGPQKANVIPTLTGCARIAKKLAELVDAKVQINTVNSP